MKNRTILYTMAIMMFCAFKGQAADTEPQSAVGLVITECLSGLDFVQKKEPAHDEFRKKLTTAANACSWSPKKMGPIWNTLIQKQNFRPQLCQKQIRPLMCEGAKKKGDICCSEVSVSDGSATNVKGAQLQEKVQGRDSSVEAELKKAIKRIKAANKNQKRPAS